MSGRARKLFSANVYRTPLHLNNFIGVDMHPYSMPELHSGDTYVWIPESVNPVLLRVMVLHWLYGLKRFDDAQIVLIKFQHWMRNNVDMPDKRKQKPQNSDNDFIGFVNIQLSDDEFAEIDKIVKSKDAPILEHLLEFLLDVGKISINYYKGSLNLTLVLLEGEMAGYGVSAFSDNLYETATIVAYKVEHYKEQFASIFKNGGQRRQRG